MIIMFGFFSKKESDLLSDRDQRIQTTQTNQLRHAETSLDQAESSFSKIVDHAGAGELMAAKFEAEEAGFNGAAHQFEHMLKFGTKSADETNNRIALAGAQCRKQIDRKRDTVDHWHRSIDQFKNR